ncbi:hypothetical protein ACFLZR_00305, partial [Candidatus Neomarinimicrobiota bacterium]
EFYDRAMNMRNSVDLAQQFTESSIQDYADGRISIQDLLQTVSGHLETEARFIDIYLDYRTELLDLIAITYWDYERGMSLYDEFDLRYEN